MIKKILGKTPRNISILNRLKEIEEIKPSRRRMMYGKRKRLKITVSNTKDIEKPVANEANSEVIHAPKELF